LFCFLESMVLCEERERFSSFFFSRLGRTSVPFSFGVLSFRWREFVCRACVDSVIAFRCFLHGLRALKKKAGECLFPFLPDPLGAFFPSSLGIGLFIGRPPLFFSPSLLFFNRHSFPFSFPLTVRACSVFFPLVPGWCFAAFFPFPRTSKVLNVFLSRFSHDAFTSFVYFSRSAAVERGRGHRFSFFFFSQWSVLPLCVFGEKAFLSWGGRLFSLSRSPAAFRGWLFPFCFERDPTRKLAFFRSMLVTRVNSSSPSPYRLISGTFSLSSMCFARVSISSSSRTRGPLPPFPFPSRGKTNGLLSRSGLCFIIIFFFWSPSLAASHAGLFLFLPLNSYSTLPPFLKSAKSILSLLPFL